MDDAMKPFMALILIDYCCDVHKIQTLSSVNLLCDIYSQQYIVIQCITKKI